MDLMEYAVACGKLADGEARVSVGGRALDGQRIRVLGVKRRRRRSLPWSADEHRYLEEQLGWMTLEEIGERLGRTPLAVKLHQTRTQTAPGSKRPGWMTGRQAADALGVDIHTVMRLHRTGILNFRRMAGERGILLIRQVTLYRWAVQPGHWMMFKPEKMGDGHLRRLVDLAQMRWGDEWWRIGEVAAYHGVHVRAVNTAVRSGKVPAVDWGNWWIKKSDAVKMRFVVGKGKNTREWSARADEFILRARDEMGLQYQEIARMMGDGWDWRKVAYRYKTVVRGQRTDKKEREA